MPRSPEPSALPPAASTPPHPDAVPPPQEVALRDLLSQRYRMILVRYFQRRVADAAEAEDLAQEVFIRLVRQPEAVAVRHAEAFLFQVATNVLRDKYRRDSVRHRGQHEELRDTTPAGEAPSEEVVYQDREMLQRMVRALEELTPKCRAVFLLNRYEGLSYSEIARRMGVSVSAIEKHMMAAIKHLHQRLDVD